MTKSLMFLLVGSIKVINDANVIMVFNIKSKNMVLFEEIIKLQNRS